ncbi:Uncharacterised protein [uncultured Eubacterium sp.]|nr:Uncharacterised protein [uncultured Eubacterium sp.]
MDIVALLEVLVKEIIAAEEKFLKNPKDFGSITNFVGFPIPLVALSAHIE